MKKKNQLKSALTEVLIMLAAFNSVQAFTPSSNKMTTHSTDKWSETTYHAATDLHNDELILKHSENSPAATALREDNPCVLSVEASSISSNVLNDEICSGGSVLLTVNGGSLGDGADWKWYKDNCGSSPLGTGATLSLSLINSTATYHVRAEGTCNTTICVNITVKVKAGAPVQSVTVPMSGMPVNACPGTTANLSIPAVANASVYTWDGPPGTTFDGNATPYISSSPNVAIVFGTTNNSMYSIGVQSGNACGNSVRKIQKVRYSVSAPSAISGETTVCANTSRTYTTNKSEGATAYQWSITGDATVTQVNDTTVTVNFGPAWNGGNLCVAAKTSCYTTLDKCLTLSKAAGNFGIITGTFTACASSIENFSVTPGNGIATYNWTVPSNSTVSGGQGTNAVGVFFLPNYNNVGNVCVTSTSICGVTSAPKCRTVAPGLPPRPATVAGITNGLCGSNSVIYSAPQMNGVTYNWTVPTGATIVSGNGTKSIKVNYGNIATGQICVTTHNNCGTSPERCITVKGAPNTPAGLTTDPSSWCAYDAGIEFTANVSNVTGIYGLSWAYPNSATYVQGGGNTTSLVLDWGGNDGTVMVTASNACGTGTRVYNAVLGCRESGPAAAAKLNVYPNPTAGMLNVEYPAEKGTAQITVFDLSGRVVMTQTQQAVSGQNTIQLDMSRLAKGAYMLNVQTQSGNNQVRIVVE